jgi:hypothetical protein
MFAVQANSSTQGQLGDFKNPAWFKVGFRSRSSPERGKACDYHRNPRSGELPLRNPNLPDSEPSPKSKVQRNCKTAPNLPSIK